LVREIFSTPQTWRKVSAHDSNNKVKY